MARASLFFSVLMIVILISGCAPPGGWGTVNAQSDPPGADVTHDGSVVATTPAEIKLIPVGRFEASVDLEGYYSRRVAVNITPTSVHNLALELIKKPDRDVEIELPEQLSRMFWGSLTYADYKSNRHLWSDRTDRALIDLYLERLAEEWDGQRPETAPAFYNDFLSRIYELDFEVTEVAPGLVLTRARGRRTLGKDTQLLLVMEGGGWRVLLPGWALEEDGFFQPYGLTSVDSDGLGTGDSLVRWLVERTLGISTNAGQKTFRGYSRSGDRADLHLNGRLTFGATNAYRERLTASARQEFAEDAARMMRELFLLNEGAEEILVHYHVPMFVDSFGNVEQKYVGYASMVRDTYEQINWNDIRLSMVQELLEVHWLY